MQSSWMTQALPGIALLAFIIGCIAVFINDIVKRRRYPPSKGTWPIIGNALLLRKKGISDLFDELAEQQGDIFTFWAGPKPMVVLNTYDLAEEAFVQRGNDVAGRALLTGRTALLGPGKGIVGADFSVDLLHRRRLATQGINVCSGKDGNLNFKLKREFDHLIKFLEANDGKCIDLKTQAYLTVANIISSAMFGQRYEIDDKEFLTFVESFDKFVVGLEKVVVANNIPFVRWFNTEAAKLLHDYATVRDSVIGKKIDEHAEVYDPESPPRDFLDVLLAANRAGGEEMSRDTLIVITGDMFTAGIESSATTMLWGVLQLAIHPEKQKRLQMELDGVFGGEANELDMSQLPRLPYLIAIVDEISRVASVAAIGIPHKTTKATIIGGYDIPKDTTVVANLHRINTCNRVWCDGDRFLPERFLPENPNMENPHRAIPFSMGSRGCLGKAIARRELYHFFANVYLNFDLTAPPTTPLTDSIAASRYTRAPHPFKVHITKRARGK